MLFKIWFPLILILEIILDVNAGKSNDFNLSKPTKITNCKAELDDKTIIDLSSLNNKNNPRFKKYKLAILLKEILILYYLKKIENMMMGRILTSLILVSFQAYFEFYLIFKLFY
jgi:hypothetical protein